MARKPVEVRLVSLQSFLVCARLGNLANAAREMGLSRPALWQQVRGLEHAFDADFFHRRRYGVELTREGELLRDLATPLLANFQGLRRSFDERRSRVPTVLRVACPNSIVEAEMVPVIGEFRRQAPSVTIQFLETWSENIPGMVLAGESLRFERESVVGDRKEPEWFRSVSEKISPKLSECPVTNPRRVTNPYLSRAD